ncbi:hypothetical protein [Pseudoteredinibacter isoporae]|uniref:hypothetical protein n=1 Tax=Pseudoteredinibacter isoporae TaxID=570281 RepID=UPI003104B9A0
MKKGKQNVLRECRKAISGLRYDLRQFEYKTLFRAKLDFEEEGRVQELVFIEEEISKRPEEVERQAKADSRIKRERVFVIARFICNLYSAVKAFVRGG